MIKTLITMDSLFITSITIRFDEASMESCCLTTAPTTQQQQQQQQQQQHHHHQQQQTEERLSNSLDARIDSCGAEGKGENKVPRRKSDGEQDCKGGGRRTMRVRETLEEVGSLEEARTVIGALRARQKAQAHQMLAWRRTLKLQEELVARLTREKAEQLRSLSSQLLLFESRLCRKQKEIEANLAQREAIILRQQRVIKQLQSKLRFVMELGSGTGSLASRATLRDSPPCDPFDRLDSLGDSDSAVVLEEAFHDDPGPPRFRSNVTDITVIRSVSDAVEPSNKYSLSRRGNGFLRRPEVLETVYSVEEDADADNKSNEGDRPQINNNNNTSNQNANNAKTPENQQQQQPPHHYQRKRLQHQQQVQSDQQQRRSSDSQTVVNEKHRLQDIYGSFERLAQQHHYHQQLQQQQLYDTSSSCCSEESLSQILSAHHHHQQQQQQSQVDRPRDDSQQAQVTYNRVMSNHRSVTKPKDVKYKRINKAKSKSLEELRGRLKNWVEKGNKIAISLDQSYA